MWCSLAGSSTGVLHIACLESHRLVLYLETRTHGENKGADADGSSSVAKQSLCSLSFAAGYRGFFVLWGGWISDGWAPPERMSERLQLGPLLAFDGSSHAALLCLCHWHLIRCPSSWCPLNLQMWTIRFITSASGECLQMEVSLFSRICEYNPEWLLWLVPVYGSPPWTWAADLLNMDSGWSAEGFTGQLIFERLKWTLALFKTVTSLGRSKETGCRAYTTHGKQGSPEEIRKPSSHLDMLFRGVGPVQVDLL